MGSSGVLLIWNLVELIDISKRKKKYICSKYFQTVGRNSLMVARLNLKHLIKLLQCSDRAKFQAVGFCWSLSRYVFNQLAGFSLIERDTGTQAPCSESHFLWPQNILISCSIFENGSGQKKLPAAFNFEKKKNRDKKGFPFDCQIRFLFGAGF